MEVGIDIFTIHATCLVVVHFNARVLPKRSVFVEVSDLQFRYGVEYFLFLPAKIVPGIAKRLLMDQHFALPHQSLHQWQTIGCYLPSGRSPTSSASQVNIALELTFVNHSVETQLFQMGFDLCADLGQVLLQAVDLLLDGGDVDLLLFLEGVDIPGDVQVELGFLDLL